MFGRLLFQQTVRQPLILPHQTAIQPDIPLDATAARQYLVPPQKSQRRLPISNASLQNLHPARSAISASALIFHHMPRPFQAFQQSLALQEFKKTLIRTNARHFRPIKNKRNNNRSYPLFFPSYNIQMPSETSGFRRHFFKKTFTTQNRPNHPYSLQNRSDRSNKKIFPPPAARPVRCRTTTTH